MPSDALLSLAFLLSGAAGLIFQVVWFHRASLVLGSSLWAVTVVLSAFMCGLALGNAAAWRLARRVDRLLRLYASLEIVAAASGLAVTMALPSIGRVVGPLTRGFDAAWAVNLVRVAAAFTALVVPAAAMGAMRAGPPS